MSKKIIKSEEGIKKIAVLDKLDLSSIEEKILFIDQQESGNRIAMAKFLYLVQLKELFKQQGYSRYSTWLLTFSEQLSKGESTLWDYRKVGSMLYQLNLNDNNLNCSIRGLFQIALMYSINNDYTLARYNISQLSNKNTSVKNLILEYKKLKLSQTTNNIIKAQVTCDESQFKEKEVIPRGKSAIEVITNAFIKALQAIAPPKFVYFVTSLFVIAPIN